MQALEWITIAGEKSRTYIFPGGNRVTVEGVVTLCVRPSGTHRLQTQNGKKVIVAAGWLAIEVDATEWSA